MDARNDKSEPTSSGTRALGSIRDLASAVAAIIALMAALSPLFGKEGLANVIPLPDDLEATGRALISVFTLTIFTFFAIPTFLGRPGRINYILSGAILIISILLFGVYLSWIDDGGAVAAPAISPFSAGVIAITTISAAVGLLAAALIVWAGQSLGVKDGTSEFTQEVAEPPHKKPTKDRTKIEELSILAFTANWRRIAELAPDRSGLFWGLYGAIARLITTKNRPRPEIKKVRGFLRLAGLVQAFHFRSRSEKRYLLNIAKAVYLLLEQASDAWATIDSFSAHRRESRSNLREGKLKKVYKDGYLKWLDVAVWMPVRSFGHDLVIEDIQEAYSALISFRSSAREEFLGLYEINRAEESLPTIILPLFVGLGSVYSDPVLKAKYEFVVARNKAILDSYYDVLGEDKRGHWNRLADAGYELAKNLAEAETSVRKGSIEKNAFPAHLSQAFCIAIAGDVDGVTLRKLKALAYVYQNAVAWRHADAPLLAQRLISLHEALREDDVDDALMKIVERAHEEASSLR